MKHLTIDADLAREFWEALGFSTQGWTEKRLARIEHINKVVDIRDLVDREELSPELQDIYDVIVSGGVVTLQGFGSRQPPPEEKPKEEPAPEEPPENALSEEEVEEETAVPLTKGLVLQGRPPNPESHMGWLWNYLLDHLDQEIPEDLVLGAFCKRFSKDESEARRRLRRVAYNLGKRHYTLGFKIVWKRKVFKLVKE